ncbi:elongation factor G [Tuwongella immobilis]|uniref:Elongation factor G n=1 Tax=Tuwongella immobilis TaxID=692036 RepID=A0A6C2YMB3_9BACT|nr:elongation factor G [Tuwongella immobilis]VIP02504.1 translation elongation factor g : Elongation factor G OS=Singulisphaera acidiphila (strain ATCC BAA-1392 / DSM 18658 / VKM B-2454 / MOB10) GN=fusA PE=3 SV=1: GTP_EFTU: GTP_EFTU_D2: EFG_II: EFG_IV: EFG_C [Tuwongella immobilis]VTS01600.1 translation elongation factor g : Elongation factor G OS=Singulisphaera acidiphila (strain ATCC BAA-1392 / DSM 18658 / VKM B-2454 / MOB10) GN=fusA PE=3 SV=1: GTP_EFTU: GTP_EFTU_D2: EFG_II: EFG_IV: EFG_C [Tuwon
MAKEQPNFDLRTIRNIGVIAHIDAGKTTTTEHLLYYSGAKHKLGAVDDGNTETDYDVEEQNRGITIYSACVPFKWLDCTVNLIDTPGHVDFTAEVERSLRVLDGAIVVFDAQRGVEAQTETVWRQANKYNVPRIVFMNKMDVVGANFDRSVADVVERLSGNPVPIFMPIGAGGQKDTTTPFCGIIDLIRMKALYFEGTDKGKSVREAEIPEDLSLDAQDRREKMLDALSRFDDALTEAMLEGRDIDEAMIRNAIRTQTISGQIQPVFCGSGREHIGIQPLLDGITYYLPSPLDRPPIVGTNPKKPDKEERRKPDLQEPFAGLVFKVITSDHGELSFIRIYSGTLKANSRLFNPGKDKKEVVGKIFRVHADPKVDREDLPEAYAGDIIATMNLKDTVTGDTLCETQHPILLEKIVFAEAVVSQSIEPESSADKDRLADTLSKLNREDPTFLYRIDSETGQMLMSGMGTLHLEVKKNRMERDFRLKVRVGKPRVSYREMLRDPITVVGEFIRTAGSTSFFAKVVVKFDNQKNDQSATVNHRIKPNHLKAEFLTAAERGLRNGLMSGALGYPILNTQATIIDAEQDELLSNEVAFEAAGNDAVQKALQDNVILLEPIMKVAVTVPDDFVGNIIADLSARGAEITKTESTGKLMELEALVPLAKMFDYADKARSLSQGRAASSLTPSHYAAAPESVLRAMLDPDSVGY